MNGYCIFLLEASSVISNQSFGAVVTSSLRLEQRRRYNTVLLLSKHADGTELGKCPSSQTSRTHFF